VSHCIRRRRAFTLDLERLRQPDITFWSAWRGSELLGCGALKALDTSHGEIKSMRTVPRHLRKGAAARCCGTSSTKRSAVAIGAQPRNRVGRGVCPARTLYAKHGFVVCGPFADYVEDPYSVFMSRDV
jgi:putative acetyltransferase